MRFRLLLVGLLMLLLSACSSPSLDLSHPETNTLPTIEPVNAAPINVVATTDIIGDVVKNVGQKHINLTILTAPGQDPHTYQPVSADAAALETAHIIFVNGFDLEETMMSTIESTAGGIIVPVSARIDAIESPHQEAGNDVHNHAQDPHVWMNPGNVMIWTQNIADVLSAADPSHVDDYQTNAQQYIEQLQILDKDINLQIEAIPIERRRFVTDHDTFQYFAQAYDFEIVGTVIESFSSTQAVSGGELAELTTLIEEENVPGIFISFASSEQIRDLAYTIADEIGRDFFVLPLYVGSLGEGDAGTYIGMMRYNVDVMVNVLGE